MIVLKAAQEKLLSALQAVAGIVERRHTLPILANVLMRKNGAHDRVHDQRPRDPGAHRAPSSAATRGSFATTVGARKLIDILRTLPADQMVTLSATQNKLTLQGGKSRFTLQTLPADDFPLVSEAADFGPTFSVPQKTLQAPDQPGALRDGGARHPLLPERHPVRRRRQEPDAGGHRRPPPRAGAGARSRPRSRSRR